MQLGDRKFFAGRIRLHQAEIGHHRDWSLAWKPQSFACVSTVQMPDGRHEIQFFHKRARGLLQHQHHLSRATCNLWSSAGARKARGRFSIISEDSSVDISEAIDLCRTKKTDIHPAAFQPLTEDFCR